MLATTSLCNVECECAKGGDVKTEMRGEGGGVLRGPDYSYRTTSVVVDTDSTGFN
jgi:hypothetical protein